MKKAKDIMAMPSMGEPVDQMEHARLSKTIAGIRKLAGQTGSDSVLIKNDVEAALDDAGKKLTTLEHQADKARQTVAAEERQHSAIFPQPIITPQIHADMREEEVKGVVGNVLEGLTPDRRSAVLKEVAKTLHGARNRPIPLDQTVHLQGGEEFYTKRGKLYRGNKADHRKPLDLNQTVGEAGIKDGDSLLLKKGNLYKGVGGVKLPANMPKLHGDDGKPRRICDVLSATPWAIQNYRSPGFHHIPTSAASDVNLDVASHILKERVTVVFADEVMSDLGREGPSILAGWTETPGSMPPFPTLWVEARTNVDAEFVAFAAMGMTIDLEGPPDERVEMAMLDTTVEGSRVGISRKMLSELKDGVREQVRAIVGLTIWIQRRDGTIWGPISNLIYFIDKTFRVMVMDPMEAWNTESIGVANRDFGSHFGGRSVPIFANVRLSQLHGFSGKEEPINAAVLVAASAFARTCGLMNASNIRYVPAGRTNEAVSEKRRGKERLAWVRYHVLKLKVGSKLRSLEPPKGTGDRATPLTMVRGHFKNFAAAGLFGKYKGDKYSHIWCPNFVRGNVEDGVVLKDYDQGAKPEGAS